mmetsp:Transcript_148551/g.386242  ORF Transcript_148551/g.386242 Transcript_148551/m.386242 type:complete len:279 (+) Transcript_148551:100-936(+)
MPAPAKAAGMPLRRRRRRRRRRRGGSRMRICPQMRTARTGRRQQAAGAMMGSRGTSQLGRHPPGEATKPRATATTNKTSLGRSGTMVRAAMTAAGKRSPGLNGATRSRIGTTRSRTGTAEINLGARTRRMIPKIGGTRRTSPLGLMIGRAGAGMAVRRTSKIGSRIGGSPGSRTTPAARRPPRPPARARGSSPGFWTRATARGGRGSGRGAPTEPRQPLCLKLGRRRRHRSCSKRRSSSRSSNPKRRRLTCRPMRKWRRRRKRSWRERIRWYSSCHST